MKIGYLKLKNFMLYKKFYESFADKDIIGILAEWKSNSGRSNQAGKTTIIEAIIYLLTKQSRAKKDSELIHYGKDSMELELGLIDGDDIYVIKRTCDSKNKTTCELSGVEGSKKKEVQKAIDELIGFNKEDLLFTLFVQQNDIDSLMKLDPAKKQKQFMEWFENKHWKEKEAIAREGLDKYSTNLSDIRSKIDVLKDQLVNSKNLKAEIKEIEEDVTSRNKKIELCERKFKKLEKKLSKLDQKDGLIEEEKYVSGDLIDVKNHLNEKKKHKIKRLHVKKLIVRLKSELKGCQDPKKLNSALVELKSLRHDSKKYVDTADDRLTGVCPVLNAPCDRVKCNPLKIRRKKKDVKEFDQRMSRVEASLTKIEDLKTKLSVASESLSFLDGSLGTVDRLKAEKSKIEAILARNKEAMTKLSKHSANELEEKANVLRQKIEKNSEAVLDLIQDRSSLEAQLKLNQKTKLQLKGLREKESKLETKVADYRYQVFMFGKAGIPSLELENSFGEIEEQTNYVLEQLGTTFELEFTPDRETTQWEDNCLNCGFVYPKFHHGDCKCGRTRVRKRRAEFNLKILNDGEEENFYMESGGGKLLFSLAIRIAIALNKKEKSGSKLDVMILDEPDSALDDVNKHYIMNLVTTSLIKKFGFQQVFWISHDKNIQNSLPHVLRVIRYKKRSEVQWA